MQETLYLCDGNVETCSKTGCYKRGFECRHTTDVAHAINRRAVAGLFLTEQETFGKLSPRRNSIKPERKPPLTVGSSQGRLCAH